MDAKKVRELAHLANTALLTGTDGATASDVFGAYFMMAGAAIDTAKEMGIPPEALRQLVHTLLLRCDDVKMVKH